MSSSLPVDQFNQDNLIITLSEFRGLPSISLDMTALKTAERRLIEAKTVTPMTYTDLEYTFGEAYRDLKKHLATVGYQILKTKAELEKSKASALLDKYPVFLATKPSRFDNAAVRDAFLARDEEVQAAQERLDSLVTLEVFIEGRIKVMENVCQYMRNAMKLVARSGTTGDMPYNGGGR